MIVIPKEEIDRENELRYDLLQKKNAYARLVFEYQKTHPGFIGTQEQINKLEDYTTRVAFQRAYTDAMVAASRIDCLDTWFADVLAIIEQLREEEENKVEEAK